MMLEGRFSAAATASASFPASYTTAAGEVMAVSGA